MLEHVPERHHVERGWRELGVFDWLYGADADPSTRGRQRLWTVTLGTPLALVLIVIGYAAPLMAGNEVADIVNLSSTAGRRADAGAAVYNLTKWGVNGFSEALRQEALHSRIRVTTVEPG